MQANSKHNLPEILLPVGDWGMLRAAVHNGADAVYIGMPGFNARGRAPTLELDELKAMIDYAHLYGLRVLLAFNILIFERELDDAIRALMDVIPRDSVRNRCRVGVAQAQLVEADTQQ